MTSYTPVDSDFSITAPIAPITVVKGLEVNTQDVYYDMQPVFLDVQINAGQFMQAELGLVGGKHTYTSSTTAIYSHDDLVEYEWDTCSVQVGGTHYDNFESISIRVTEGISLQHTLSGSKEPARYTRSGFRTVDIGGTMIFDNRDQYDDFLDLTERALTITFGDSGETINVPLFRDVEFSAPITPNPGFIRTQFKGSAVRLNTDSAAIFFSDATSSA